MEKINVAELLKDCPKGMELDCTIWNNVTFDHIDMTRDCPIYIRIEGDGHEQLTGYGQWNHSPNAKCVIFPKGKTTWKGFHRPFKDGDVIHICDEYSDITYTYVAIFKQIEKGGKVYSHCFYDYEHDEFNTHDYLHDDYSIRFATEEEKAELFQAIKDNGYNWNTETKTLEKLIEPEFKVGDRIKRKGDTRLTTIKDIRDNYYIITIPDFFDNAYITDKLLFSNQNEYEIVPNRFDLNTLKPFDKVLVRGDVGQKWTHDFFGFMDKDKGFPFVCVGHYVIQCIPYEGNEHLLGKTTDCDEYFKTWKSI